ncbi:MAG: cation:proton antiporter [Candidatus Micrarchaeia archaeon]
MEEILLLTAVVYATALIIGYLTDKYLKMPWMFALVMFGIIFSAFGLFTQSTKSESFNLLANLGMLILLFTIGLDLDLEEIKSLGAYIALGDISLCFFEGLMLAMLFYFLFPADVSNSFPIALIAGITFGTIGEVVLFAILSEFDLVHTKFGQLSLGMGVFDDIVEVGMLAIIATLPLLHSAGEVQNTASIISVFSGLGGLLLVTLGILKIRDGIRKILEKVQPPLYVPIFLTLVIPFSFIALSGLVYENLAPVAAIISGVVVQQAFPDKMLKENRKLINFLSMFLSPFFFLSLGIKISFSSFIASPSLAILIVLVSFTARVLASVILFRKLFGIKHAFILGVGLCVKFSTSIVSETLLFTSGFISAKLFSALMTAYVIMKPIIVAIYSKFLSTSKAELIERFSTKTPKSNTENADK